MGNIKESSEDKKEINNRFGYVKVKYLYAAKCGTERENVSNRGRVNIQNTESFTKLTQIDKQPSRIKRQRYDY